MRLLLTVLVLTVLALVIAPGAWAGPYDANFDGSVVMQRDGDPSKYVACGGGVGVGSDATNDIWGYSRFGPCAVSLSVSNPDWRDWTTTAYWGDIWEGFTKRGSAWPHPGFNSTGPDGALYRGTRNHWAFGPTGNCCWFYDGYALIEVPDTWHIEYTRGTNCVKLNSQQAKCHRATTAFAH